MRTLYPEFRDELAGVRYPFGDAASLTATDNMRIALGMFVDASLYPLGASPPLYLGTIRVAARRITLVIKDAKQVSVATTTFDPIAPGDALALVDGYDRPAGVLVINPETIVNLSTWNAGDHNFLPATTAFAASCVIPLPAGGVAGLLDRQANLFAGDVWLVGDNGVVLRSLETGVVRIDVVGDPLSRRALLSPLSMFTTPNFIRTINGCPPDQFGNFNFTIGNHSNAQTVLRLRPAGAGLALEMVGCEP